MSPRFPQSLIARTPRFTVPVALRGFGSFLVGGRLATVETHPPAIWEGHGDAVAWPQSGTFAVGQLYAQIFLPDRRSSPHPLVFWHGGGLSGAQWETTPDGRAGWLVHALAEGRDVIVTDAAERGRAGIPHPALVFGEPVFRPSELAWTGFRIGPESGYGPDPSARRAFPGQAFPTEAFDVFCRLFTARWPGFAAAIQDAYAALIADMLAPPVIVAHSEGALYALDVAAQDGSAIAGLVLIEPAGAPPETPARGLARLAGLPMLAIWGDHFRHHARWRLLRARFDGLADRLAAGGGQVETLDLPASGIPGNSHFPMMDRNSEQIWERIAAWIDRLPAAPAAAEGGGTEAVRPTTKPARGNDR